MAVADVSEAAVKAGVEHWLERAEAKVEASPEEHVRALLAAVLPVLRREHGEQAAAKIQEWVDDCLSDEWEEAYTAAIDSANIVRKWGRGE